MKNFYLLAFIALGIGFTACNDEEQLDRVEVIGDSQPSAAIPAKGFYVANEDWFGHDNGSVNYFKNDGSIIYRAYRAANTDETLGVTPPFATIYGDYMYFLSKQGNRLVVADANTLKKKAVFTDIGGDGRSFVGVDDKIGYIGHSNGVRQFDIASLQLGNPVVGISGQIGAMCSAAGRVFALAQQKVYIIDVATNAVEKVIEGSFNTLTRSKDGTVWIATANKFIKLNPVTLEEETMEYPGGVKVGSSWGAWNAGTLCASTQTNTLYWGKGSTRSCGGIVKYDIDTKTFNADFYTLGEHEGKTLTFYAAGFRVDPITDRIVGVVTRGYENYNWVHIIAPNGTLEKNIPVNGSPADANNGYYWFPAVPFFEDPNSPEILVNQILLNSESVKSIDLNQKIVDADNTSVSIIRKVEFYENELVIYTFVDGILTITPKVKEGHTTCRIIAISNGKRVEKIVPVEVRCN